MAHTKTIGKTSRSVGRYVNAKHVDALLNQYKQERWVQNSKHIGKEDSLSVWYSVAELQEFLETARRNGADGIKMFFGVYTAGTARDDRYEGRQTIVMVASKNKVLANGTGVDKSVYITTDKGPEILAYNTGRICPPTCGSGTEIGVDLDTPGILIDKKDEGMIVI